jgi:hypothetical protein
MNSSPHLRKAISYFSVYHFEAIRQKKKTTIAFLQNVKMLLDRIYRYKRQNPASYHLPGKETVDLPVRLFTRRLPPGVPFVSADC